MAISLEEQPDSIEAMVGRVVHLGFEVRVELELPDGSRARAQLTRQQADELEIDRGDIVYIRPPAGMPVSSGPAPGVSREPDGAAASPSRRDRGRRPSPSVVRLGVGAQQRQQAGGREERVPEARAVAQGQRRPQRAVDLSEEHWAGRNRVRAVERREPLQRLVIVGVCRADQYLRCRIRTHRKSQHEPTQP